ncbi:MAG: peptidoglycan-binding protein [Novosphingobium sp.]
MAGAIMKGALCLAVATGIALPGLARADNGDGQFAVEGSGRATCQQFSAARRDQQSADYRTLIGFVEGYLTAANRYEPETFDLSPWHNEAGFGLILEKHCAEHPEESLVGSLQKLVIGLRPIRVAQFSKLVEVGDGTNRALVYEAILKRAQAALKRRGLYRGAEDGSFSPALRDAVKQFQKQQGLTATGVPDPATLWTLLNP